MAARRRGGWLLAGLVASLLVGCGNEDEDTAQSNLARWQAKGPTSYVYIIKTGCFCGNIEPVRVVVTDGVVTSALGTESATVQPAKTMTDLLKDVVHRADQRNATFAASYDPTLGYLKQLSIDPDSHTSDDEMSIEVSCLAPGISDDVCPAP